jgi:hypothetical protein
LQMGGVESTGRLGWRMARGSGVEGDEAFDLDGEEEVVADAEAEGLAGGGGWEVIDEEDEAFAFAGFAAELNANGVAEADAPLFFEGGALGELIGFPGGVAGFVSEFGEESGLAFLGGFGAPFEVAFFGFGGCGEEVKFRWGAGGG